LKRHEPLNALFLLRPFDFRRVPSVESFRDSGYYRLLGFFRAGACRAVMRIAARIEEETGGGSFTKAPQSLGQA
jgi:hypothetical protein